MKFKKGIYPKTIMRKFKDASIALAALLMKEKEFSLYISVLAFLKNHPKVNLMLLQSASRLVDLKSDSTSRSLLSPLEVTAQ